MTTIEQAIEDSKYMLDMQNNYDDEGAIAVDLETWKNATKFLRDIAFEAEKYLQTIIDAPKIYHGNNGSIDMLWETETYKVLANFPANSKQDVACYGKTIDGKTIKSSFPFDGGANLIMFLVGAKQ